MEGGRRSPTGVTQWDNFFGRTRGFHCSPQPLKLGLSPHTCSKVQEFFSYVHTKMLSLAHSRPFCVTQLPYFGHPILGPHLGLPYVQYPIWGTLFSVPYLGYPICGIM